MTIANGSSTDANDVTPFGNGSDGAFNQTTGTATLTQGTIYQYTSFNLSNGATLTCSTTSQYPLIIYVQGNCTISGAITLTGKGATSSYGTIFATNGTARSTSVSGSIAEGGKRCELANFKLNQSIWICNGTAGGAGEGNQANGGGGASSQSNGQAGYYVGSGGVGGGGGGGSGDFIAIYNGTLTDNSPTITTLGGITGNTGGGTSGGAGGCTIVFIIGGNLTLNATAVINCSGANGGDGGGGLYAPLGNGADGTKVIASYDSVYFGGSGFPV